MMAKNKAFFFDSVLTDSGVENDCTLEVDDGGFITRLAPHSQPAEATDSTESAESADNEPEAQYVPGMVLPGIPNAHSHAFQRAMAGLTERNDGSEASFWSWRRAMYKLANRLTPDDMRVIALELYIEMLKSGYTSVAEFHYLHHGIDGTPYDNPGEMSLALLDAAEEAGIAITLLPSLYMTEGFGKTEVSADQRRFANDLDGYQKLWESLAKAVGARTNARLGFAIHSLRAVHGTNLIEADRLLKSLDQSAPIHIHVSEQMAEVNEAISHLGATPIRYLHETVGFDQGWTLIHATHATGAEVEMIAKACATVCLCPTTEANLGDGIFETAGFLATGGFIAIGSDSHISVDPREELRQLEYQARLYHQKRAIMVDFMTPNVGEALWCRAAEGGADSIGQPTGYIKPDKRADLIVLDSNHPVLAGRESSAAIDSFVFSGQPTPVRDVMVGGKWVVQNGRHPGEEDAAQAYLTTMRSLMTE